VLTTESSRERQGKKEIKKRQSTPPDGEDATIVNDENAKSEGESINKRVCGAGI
jgi:hypothetical protein